VQQAIQMIPASEPLSNAFPPQGKDPFIIKLQAKTPCPSHTWSHPAFNQHLHKQHCMTTPN